MNILTGSFQAVRSMAAAHRTHREEVESRQGHFIMQLGYSGFVIACAAVVYLIELIFPTFFNYSYIIWEAPTVEMLSSFWILGVYGLSLSLLTIFLGDGIYSSPFDGQLLRWGLITGNMAALWEEFGFRCVFICFSMIGLVVTNFILGSIPGVLLIMLSLWLASEIADSGSHVYLLIPFVLIGLGVYTYTIWDIDPIYWLYEVIFMPLLNFVSLGSFTEILNDTERFPSLFVMGALAANVKFRDGHKYQGPIGTMNSWIIGFVMVYAMCTYGLLTAVALHALWNTQIYLLRFILRKIL